MKDCFDGFYRDKKVLITGHTGFKGAWLSAWLLELGAEVTGYALEAPTVPSLFGVTGLSEKVMSIMGDVRDYAKLKDVLEKRKPEIVIHMAAQSLVRRSYKDPLLTYETNIMGTANVLESCRHVPSVCSIVNVTSDKCYENWGKSEGYKENDPMGGYDPYSSSKGCSELVTRAYLKSFFNPENYKGAHKIAVASARAGNVIGGGDWAMDRLIPDIIRAYKSGEPLVIRYPEAVRPWQHVLEPLCGYMLLAKNLYETGGKYSGAWNFGPDLDGMRPVSWLADFSEKVLKTTGSWIKDGSVKPHEEKYLFLDSSKAKAELGWSGVWNVEKALEKTLGWYKAYFLGEDMYNFTVSQIGEYIRQDLKSGF